jgi:isopenicillin N synthase-like dioxygenase
MEQMQTLGFLVLTNVPGFDEPQLLEAAKWFFSLTPEEKTKLYTSTYNPANHNHYRGVYPFIENDPSHKEIYDIGCNYKEVSEEEKQFTLQEETPWPQGLDKSEWFSNFMISHYKAMHSLGLNLMSHIAEGLGKSRYYFDNWFAKDTLSTQRIIHYLPRKDHIVDQSKLSEDELQFTTPIHTDSGFLTLLTTFNYPGLQVEIGDEYRSVRPSKDVLVVNLGDMLSRITNFSLKATKHRVLDIGVERFSSPFFLEPHFSAGIPTLLGEGN